MNIRSRFIALVLISTIAPALAPVSVRATAQCEFILGFAALKAAIDQVAGPEKVGACLENEHVVANGNVEQHTTGGLLVWRQADNWTAFTDGYRTWINGPYGLQVRLNTERFFWEPPTSYRGISYGGREDHPDLRAWIDRFGELGIGIRSYDHWVGSGKPRDAQGRPTRPPRPTRYSGTSWGYASSGRSDASETTITEHGLRHRVFKLGWQTWERLDRTTGDFVFRATGVQTEGDGGGILLTIGSERETGFLEFYISLTSGRAYLSRRDPAVDEWHLLTNNSNLPNLPQRGRRFTLEVRAEGQRIRGSLNGTVILEAHDPLYLPGFIGLGVAAHRSSGPVTVEWQSAELHSLSAEGDQPVPPTVRARWAVHNGAEGRLLRALELLWIHNVNDWQYKYGRRLANRGTEIVWGTLPEKVGGRYSRSINRITINESQQSEPLSVLAAILAHEVYHAVSGRASSDAADCLEEEMIAFSWQAGVWKPFRSALGWIGNDDDLTAGERSQEAIYRAWRDRELRDTVLTSEGYQLQCLGRVLPDF